MTEPYLIAHVVRGQPAFDIAERFRCPVCEAVTQGLDPGTLSNGCVECDHEGYWWIIPTSGHRARPYWNRRLDGVFDSYMPDIFMRPGESEPVAVPAPPPNWPDHYPTKQAKAPADPTAGRSLLASLGLLKPSEPIKRRI